MNTQGITVNQLLKYLKKEAAKGHGDYKIFVTDDEEANGYHSLWYVGQTAIEIELDQGEDMRAATEQSNCDLSILGENTEKAIYLG